MTGNRRMYFLLNMKDSQVPSAMDVHCSPVFFLTRLGCDLVIYKVSYYDPCPICKKTDTSDNHPPQTNSLQNGNLYLPLFKPKNILKKRNVTTNLALLLSIFFKHGPTTKTNLLRIFSTMDQQKNSFVYFEKIHFSQLQTWLDTIPMAFFLLPKTLADSPGPSLTRHAQSTCCFAKPAFRRQRWRWKQRRLSRGHPKWSWFSKGIPQKNGLKNEVKDL